MRKYLSFLCMVLMSVSVFAKNEDLNQIRKDLSNLIKQRNEAISSLNTYVEEKGSTIIDKRLQQLIKNPDEKVLRDVMEAAYILMPYDQLGTIGDIFAPFAQKHNSMFLRVVKEMGKNGDAIFESVQNSIREDVIGN